MLTQFSKGVTIYMRILCGFQKIYLVWGVLDMKRKILLVGIGALVLVTALLVMFLTKKNHHSGQKG